MVSFWFLFGTALRQLSIVVTKIGDGTELISKESVLRKKTEDVKFLPAPDFLYNQRAVHRTECADKTWVRKSGPVCRYKDDMSLC